MAILNKSEAIGLAPAGLLLLYLSSMGVLSMSEELKKTFSGRETSSEVMIEVESMKSIHDDLMLRTSDGEEVKLSREKINEIIKNIGKDGKEYTSQQTL